MGDLKQKAARVRQHPAPAKKAAEAQAAAKGPANEKRAGAKANQTDKIKDAKTSKPDPNSFLALLRAEIQKAMPKTLADTEHFMKGGDAPALKGSLKENVAQQKQAATGDTSKTTAQKPDESAVQAKPVTEIPGEPQPPSPDVPAGDAMPQPKPDADVSVQDSKQDTEAAMKDAEVTETQCKKANDPRFSAVLTAKDDVGKQADVAPVQYRANEKTALSTAVAQAKSSAKVGAMQMLHGKAKAKAGVSSKQADAKKKDEQERQQVTDRIEAIFNKTKQQVEQKLSALDEEVNTIFDSGTETALADMKQFVEQKIDDYKDDRYSGIIGKGRWIRDQFKGLPEEANVFYEQGRDRFARSMDKLVVRVANLVEQRLREAKALVAAGQAEIKTYVASLSPKLRGVGLEAQKKVADQFTELERTIDDKKNQLAQSLAQKYKEAFAKADKALKEIQDSNKGLVQKFIDKLVEIVKIILEFKDKLMAALRKGWAVIKLIIADPIGFLSNLLDALKQGFNQFKAKIGYYLIKGVLDWLFRSVAEQGITPPSDFSPASILKLVLQILGITYERLRAKAVKLIGPTAVMIIEKLVEYVRLLFQSPAALWEKVQEDLSSLKDMVLNALRDMIIEAVITAAIKKILMMFNPVGAFVAALLAIYDTVMFVIEEASRIIAFINSVLDSVAAIAQGAIGAAANKIEQALGAAIPIVIAFLARLLHLGDLPERATRVIKKIQDFVDKAIDKALAKIIAWGKSLWGKLTGKGEAKKDERTDAQKQQDVQKAIMEAKPLLDDDEKTDEEIERELKRIKNKYKLTSLMLIRDSETEEAETEHILAEINPKAQTPPKKRPKKHKSKLVMIERGKYRLKPEYSSKEYIRDSLYGKSYRTDVYSWKDRLLSTPRNKGGLRHPTEHNLYYWNGQYWDNNVTRTSATVDHKKPPVVVHWENTGRKTKHSVRKDFFNDISGGKCEVVPYFANSSAGAQMGESYTFNVTGGFRGPGE
jgi:ATP-dependent protease ClpP protease subunit